MKAIEEIESFESPDQTPFAHSYPEIRVNTLIEPINPLLHTPGSYIPRSASAWDARGPREGGNPVNVKALGNIHAFIRKYDSKWPSLGNNIVRPVSKERIVVTGTTGALGSYLLSQLLKSDKVEKIWAMNRKSGSGNSKDRQIASFEDKLLDTSLLNCEKLVFVDANLVESKLGLSKELYDEISSEATIIIHNAWEVNHSRDLKFFEPNICGTRHLLDVAFNSIAPTGLPRFVFASSIAVAGLARPGRYLNETSITLEDAATSNGYGQSKAVTEKLLESARHAGLSTCTVRIGQLTGDINSGSWSTTDWLPSIITSSISIGCLPGATGTVSWLPLDVAAHSIIDICLARAVEMPSVVHLCHPRPVPWMVIVGAFATCIFLRTGSQLPIVGFDEWNGRIKEAAESFEGSKADRYKRFPTIKIQSVLDGAVKSEIRLRARRDSGHAEFTGVVRLDITIAKALSETLRFTPELGMKHVERWFRYWDSVGFFKSV
ncbi:L-aminoadipate-semialdehyde dehydrogenase large subunit [Rhizoctonia solani]|uniref:L-aminoadipate-semialdehyde dehydrogenase large subunit n=1 Tax=Rhizoctonia solani TaxID=456999 RepID=A0A0K6FWF5_9AGAM|nr:L-aminoadipate-semialdehyde dehydrogenase large subunit [Rhizoctonia solani]